LVEIRTFIAYESRARERLVLEQTGSYRLRFLGVFMHSNF
jgi:hypothetical protein